jgi:diphosphomevalonate decarboxylase
VKKSDVVRKIFLPASSLAVGEGAETDEQFRIDLLWKPKRDKGLAFAPTNIALCKYWGKRDNELNLPVTSSLSVALPDKGAMTTVTAHDKSTDEIILNGEEVAADSKFAERTRQFLDLFRPVNGGFLHIDIKMNIPVAAGLASSACGFAALTAALNDLFDWKLSARAMSILARLGSGSAARSFWNGFVEWHAGVQSDGMDSFAEPLSYEWEQLNIGLLIMTKSEKPISSREAMQRTVDTSVLYGSWPKKVARDLVTLRQALQVKNFSLLGGAAESNALSMHATMQSSWPPVCYSLPETMAAMHKIWKLRHDGLEVYFTQDAGPNLKLLFLEKDREQVQAQFSQMEVVRLFD